MVKIFADGANKKDMLQLNDNKLIEGFTTNPTLMNKAGVKDYKNFALDILNEISDKPVSFEVFADEFKNMYEQAIEISSWGQNVYVKIPVMNTKGKNSYELIKDLSSKGVKLNITAIFTIEQVKKTYSALDNLAYAFISIFAGRIADTGIDPIPTMKESLKILSPNPNAELLWASPREVLNFYQADNIGCDIITATSEIINKLKLKDKDLNAYSQETVKMFYDDAV